MKTLRMTHVLRTALTAALLVACSTPEPASPWESRLAPALCTRAEGLLGDGDLDEARATASQALEHARSQEDRLSEARALTVLGLVDRSPALLEESLRLMEGAPLQADSWQTRLVLAQLALEAGSPATARVHLDALLASAKDWQAPVQRARAEATGYHLLATIQRADGEWELAAKNERWASLQLTVLPDHELQELRQQVAQALGDDSAARALFREAFQAHARAANIAAKLGDQQALLEASLCMSRDLVLLDRLNDAVDHFGRTLDLARELDDWASMEDIALEALHWLDTRGEPWDSRRRQPFRDTLQELSSRSPVEGVPDVGEDSTPHRG